MARPAGRGGGDPGGVGIATRMGPGVPPVGGGRRTAMGTGAGAALEAGAAAAGGGTKPTTPPAISDKNASSTLPKWIVWFPLRTASLTGARLTNVPFVEPRSLITTCPLSTTIWQCEPETEGSVILKSLAKPRPTMLVPGLSSISQACGELGFTISRAMLRLFSLVHAS